MSINYEEIMPTDINKDEYLQYYYEESLSSTDVINLMIKKGKPFQRQALLNKLDTLQTEQIFQSLLKYIINDIKTWDKETIIFFPKCLYKILTKSSQEIIISSINDELFNMILKLIIESVSSTDEQISNEYISNFEKIIIYYSNNNIKFPFNINDGICDDIISLGKFGQSNYNRKLSCYLGCAVIRLIKLPNNQIVKKLYDRICFLFSDNEKEIETQLSKELEFLIPIFKNDLFKNKDIIDVIYNYLSCDWSHAIQTTSITSLLKNLYYIDIGTNSKLISKILAKIAEIFDAEEENYEKNFKNLIFLELVNTLYNNYRIININIIKNIFKEKIINNFINKNIQEEIILDNFDKIFFIFNNITSELGIINSSNDSIDLNSCNTNYNKFIDFDSLFCSIYSIHFTNNKKKLLFNKIIDIIPLLSNFQTEKFLYDKISHIYNRDNIIQVLRCYSEKVGKNSKQKMNNKLYYLLLFLLKKNFEIFSKSNFVQLTVKNILQTKKDMNTTNNSPATENNYIKLFFLIMNNILIPFNDNQRIYNNSIHLILCDLFQRIIPKIYKYVKPCIPNPKVKLKYSMNYYIRLKSIEKLYEDINSSYLIKLLENKNVGYHIKNEVISVYPNLILYSKERDEYFKLINEKILISEKFFFRRYSIIFIKKCFEMFSFKLINKLGLIDTIISLINDQNNNISSSIIKLIFIFYKKIYFASNLTFQKICKIISKVHKTEKEYLTLNKVDIEKSRNIKIILSLDLSKKEKNDEFWLKTENKLILRENEIIVKEQPIIKHKNLPMNKLSDSPKSNSVKSKINYSINNGNFSNKKELLKDKFQKRVIIRDKYSSSSVLLQNSINNNHYNYSTKDKSNSQTILPTIKAQRTNIQSYKRITKFNLKNMINLKIKQSSTKYNEPKVNKFPFRQNIILLANNSNSKLGKSKVNDGYIEPYTVYPNLLPSLNHNKFNIEANDDSKKKTNVTIYSNK